MADAPKTPVTSHDDARISKAVTHLSSLLVPNEKLEAYAVQRRLFALNHRRTLVAATSGRFIGMTRGLFGGFDPQDVRWQDFKDAHLHVGIFGADLTIVAFTSPDLAVTGGTRVLSFTGLRKEEAEAVYRICQAQDQAWREKRRVRELEELRAKSGGIQLGSSPGASSAPASGGTGEDLATRLQRAKDMLEKGLISDSEYESLKARIVSSL
jgi:hypothetical protein